MKIDPVFEPRIAAGVVSRRIVERDRGPVRQDQPFPDQEGAALAERDDAVVAADQPSACGISKVRPLALS